MTIYKTAQRRRSPEYLGINVNYVADYEALPGDTHVQVILRSTEETYLLTRPIEDYPSILKWARGLAPYLGFHIDIVPISRQEYENYQARQTRERWPSLLCKPE